MSHTRNSPSGLISGLGRNRGPLHAVVDDGPEFLHYEYVIQL
jgi:hypothetical protein